ncbi:MAG TPA: bifunctional methylenetetrahydrofolate dehydrogenase/methenyltetrahydrofolate cyclohydrolase FolD [Polyangiaceae bacterium]|nr:bifunctional methylenetetrahydrofolate dehydrogenase/methenyltetrahydrofolate cyclohydrolase FolD [Polyangiaceae bacterium]
MAATVLSGKAISERVRAEAAEGAARFLARHGRQPGLYVVLAGEDPASAVYVRNKEKAAKEAGFAGDVIRLPASVSETELLAVVDELNRRDDVDGILVQLPLPSAVASAKVLASIDPAKDVDGFHAVNVGALWSGQAALVPCTPRGCIRLLHEAKVKIDGARAVVVGRSNIVGKPAAALLLAENATVTLAHSKTRDLAAVCREADILIAAVGRARMLGRDYIKPGAAVIDVGMNRDENGKLCGDVDFAAASEIAGVITPVPGGVGLMTIAMLLDNTLIAAEQRLSGKAPAR